MLKQFSILSLIFLSSLCAIGQTEKYAAPVKWERYKISDRDVSVLFPKLPVLTQNVDSCREKETNQYAAYAEGIVYGLNVISKTKKKVPDFCGNQKGFNENLFDERLKELMISLKAENSIKSTQNNLEITKVSNEFFAYWLVNDFKNKRWFEIWTTDEDEANLKIKNFVESVKIEKKPSGIEIEKGASRTLGDEVISEEKIFNNSDNGETPNLRIIVKPRANYTDAVRQAQVQGTVRLRVTFLASGGIGSVAAVSELPFGLTEQAVIAASKIVFIPGKRKGVNISMSKIVEYSFSIY